MPNRGSPSVLSLVLGLGEEDKVEREFKVT